MRSCWIFRAALFAVLAASGASAQDADNGRRISQRSCAGCHQITQSAGKPRHAISFSAIAAKPGMSEAIVSAFLEKPTVAMPGIPLRPSDARDVAAFIMSLKQ